jgi:hypothetical protein
MYIYNIYIIVIGYSMKVILTYNFYEIR